MKSTKLPQSTSAALRQYKDGDSNITCLSPDNQGTSQGQTGNISSVFFSADFKQVNFLPACSHLPVNSYGRTQTGLQTPPHTDTPTPIHLCCRSDVTSSRQTLRTGIRLTPEVNY